MWKRDVGRRGLLDIVPDTMILVHNPEGDALAYIKRGSEHGIAYEVDDSLPRLEESVLLIHLRSTEEMSYISLQRTSLKSRKTGNTCNSLNAARLFNPCTRASRA